jgi:O-acetyl-ADP-ribose deacetylase (regulator of RNase III)
MIEQGRGNLLTADVDALINTVNTVGVMGKGIALQFKRAYPANYEAYRAACRRDEVRLGSMFVFDTAIKGPRRYVINFPTKGHWKENSSLAGVEAGLADLVRVVEELGITSVAIPALGCGNGGLAWRDVLPLIERACSRMPEVRAVVFSPAGAPPPEAMPNVTPRPPMTRLRALLVVAIGRYLERANSHEARRGISELEIQKLVYFLQVLGVPYRHTFTRGYYGPYALDVSHGLDALEGHYLTGLGDRSARVTELLPVSLLPGAMQEAASVVTDTDDVTRLDRLLDLVDGFETPYSLELLATVHYAATHPPASREAVVVGQRVADWSLRKARLFTPDHVTIAMAQLGTHGLFESMTAPTRA